MIKGAKAELDVRMEVQLRSQVKCAPTPSRREGLPVNVTWSMTVGKELLYDRGSWVWGSGGVPHVRPRGSAKLASRKSDSTPGDTDSAELVLECIVHAV